MPDVEPLRFPSREGPQSQPGELRHEVEPSLKQCVPQGSITQDAADLEVACSGRRRTCALLNSPSPYVNGAIYHMQELKMAVENWCQQCGKHRPRFYRDRHQCRRTLRFQAKDSDSESVLLAELFVEGVAISARGSPPLSPLLKKINDVLGEVTCLIERQEADRQYAEEALRVEKRRRTFLESKVDTVSLWKQQEHSTVVQKAREACVRDMVEVKFRLKKEKEKLHQVQVKLSDTERLNQRLREDVDFAKKQICIVKENLDVQNTMISQINTAQTQADEVYSITQAELHAVQDELKTMKEEAGNENTSSEQILQMMTNQLADRLVDLNQLKVLEEDLCAEIDVAEKTVALTEENCTAIIERLPEMMELEKTEKDTLSQLKAKVDNEVHENMKLKEKITALEEDIERSKLQGEAEVSHVEEELQATRCAAAALCKENMVHEQKVEEYKKKIFESERAVTRMHAGTKQMLQQIVDNNELWEKTEVEVTQIVARHSITQARLQEQQQLSVLQEQRAKTEIESLKKDLTGQITSLELLKGQCADLEEEIKRQKASAELTNCELQKELETASLSTKALETKIQKIKKVTESVENVQCEHRNIVLNLEREKNLRQEELKAAQDLHAAIVKTCEETQDRIKELTKKCKEYQDAAERMEQMAESMPDAIAELQSAFDVVDFQNRSAALIMSTLQSDINNCQRQTQRSMHMHTAHVRARKREMEETQNLLKISLEENHRLAREYEVLKKLLAEAKEEEVSAQSRKNHEHQSLLYYTQLSLLQKRMHKALVKYFKRRSLYNRAELDRCQTLSRETDQKIKTAQEGLSEEIQLIRGFLRSLTDDSTTTTDDAGVNKQDAPDAAGSKTTNRRLHFKQHCN